MSPDEAVAKLDAIEAGDNETAHGDAEDLLWAVAPVAVQEAYLRCQKRTGPWWWA